MYTFKRIKGRNSALSFEKCNYADGACGSKEKIYKESEISTKRITGRGRESERIFCLAMG